MDITYITVLVKRDIYKLICIRVAFFLENCYPSYFCYFRVFGQAGQSSVFMWSYSKTLTTQVKKPKLCTAVTSASQWLLQKRESEGNGKDRRARRQQAAFPLLNVPQSIHILFLLAASKSPKGFVGKVQRGIQHRKHWNTPLLHTPPQDYLVQKLN